jgi:hypothetical protein
VNVNFLPPPPPPLVLIRVPENLEEEKANEYPAAYPDEST